MAKTQSSPESPDWPENEKLADTDEIALAFNLRVPEAFTGLESRDYGPRPSVRWAFGYLRRQYGWQRRQ